MNGLNFSPFYWTSFSTGAAAQKERRTTTITKNQLEPHSQNNNNLINNDNRNGLAHAFVYLQRVIARACLTGAHAGPMIARV